MISRTWYQCALRCFCSAIEVDSKDLEARVYKAICLTKIGGIDNISSAMEEYKYVIERDR
jgi:hypothetical protein